MSPFKRYTIALLLAFGPFFILVNTLTWAGLATYSGDLTRLGSYPEELFTSRETQPVFSQSLLKQHFNLKQSLSELVLIGDSFSIRRHSWAEFFARVSGLNISLLNREKITLDDLLASRQFRENPPRTVFYQVVERNVMEQVVNQDSRCEEKTTLLPLPPISVSGEGFDIATQSAATPSFGDYNRSINFLKTLYHNLAGNSGDLPARLATLARSDLFSNRLADKLLYYGLDEIKASWPADTAAKLRCWIQASARRVEENGYTAFLVILVPDKLSAYSRWLADPALRDLGILDHPELSTAGHLVNLLPLAQGAIEQGHRDFYMPNDTHWNFAARGLVAAHVLDYAIGRSQRQQ